MFDWHFGVPPKAIQTHTTQSVFPQNKYARNHINSRFFSLHPNRSLYCNVDEYTVEKCLFMNFYWMYISHTLSLANNFISFYFDVDYFPLSVMPSTTENEMHCYRNGRCARGKFCNKNDTKCSITSHFSVQWQIYLCWWKAVTACLRSIYCLSCGFEKNFTAIYAIKRNRRRAEKKKMRRASNESGGAQCERVPQPK